MLQETIHFERFELDPGAFELRRDGQLIKLERIPLQLLLLLAENRQRLVTREEILHVIWGENVFVDADNSINTAVRKARQALKDDPENPRFLRTVPGKGYRFTAEVKTVETADPKTAILAPDKSRYRTLRFLIGTCPVTALIRT
jgi:DNA-binding winged helix-turn-helix (wHTH) protein